MLGNISQLQINSLHILALTSQVLSHYMLRGHKRLWASSKVIGLPNLTCRGILLKLSTVLKIRKLVINIIAIML